MIPRARKLHRRWMVYVGQCLTVGLVPVVVCSGLLTGFREPILVAGLVGVFAVGIGMLLWRHHLAKNFNPNDEDVGVRTLYGQSRATLLSEQEAQDPLAHVGDDKRSTESSGTLVACIFAILCVAGLLSCGGFLAVHWISRAIVAARFEKDLQAYAALIPVLPPGGVEQPRVAQPGAITGKVKGKMVVVNVTERRIDDLHFALSDDLRASRPEEVTTVVLVTWGKVKISGDGPISSISSVEYQQTCQVKVFDWESKSAIASHTFFGGFPQGSLRSMEESVTGPKPDDRQMLTFLAGLPRQ
jgi:hypothetical protein